MQKHHLSPVDVYILSHPPQTRPGADMASPKRLGLLVITSKWFKSTVSFDNFILSIYIGFASLVPLSLATGC